VHFARAMPVDRDKPILEAGAFRRRGSAKLCRVQPVQFEISDFGI
jgi:hypothetical protein